MRGREEALLPHLFGFRGFRKEHFTAEGPKRMKRFFFWGGANVFYDNSADIVIKSESGTQVELLDGLVIANNILRSSSGRMGGYNGHITVTDLPAAKDAKEIQHGRGGASSSRTRCTASFAGSSCSSSPSASRRQTEPAPASGHQSRVHWRA